MDFLYWLEGLRVPVLNEFMLAITYLGDEIAFLVVALILIWNHRRKKKGTGCSGCSGCAGCPGREACHAAFHQPEDAEKNSDRLSKK